MKDIKTKVKAKCSHSSTGFFLMIYFLLLSVYCLLPVTKSNAQEGTAINTTGATAAPSAILDISATDMGVLIPRMTTAQRNAIPSPATGLLIYNTTTNTLNFYNGTTWYQIGGIFVTSTPGAVSVSGGTSINTTNTPPANSAILDVSDASRGVLIPRMTTTKRDAITSPATGLIVYNTTTNLFNYYDGSAWKSVCASNTGVSGAAGSQSSVGIAVAINTSNPTADASAMLDVSSTTKGLLIPRPTTAQRNNIAPATGLIIFNSSTNTIEYYNGTGWYKLPNNAPAAPVATAGSGATQNQITANWNASADAAHYHLDVSTVNTFASYVTGYQDLDVGNVTSYNVTGLNCGTTYYYRVRAENACGTSGVSPAYITYATLACAGCGTSVCNEVTSGGSRIWCDRNLGASQVATSRTDYLAYGSLYQWGRLSDNHQCITWTSSTTGTPVNGTTTTLSSTDVPGHSLFIIIAANGDWRTPENDNLWQGVAGTNNPCPAGFRLPTTTEWTTEKGTWSPVNRDGAYASPLKIPDPGFRYDDDGTLYDTGTAGYYWSSTPNVSAGYSDMIVINSITAYTSNMWRGRGYSVRCIKD